MNSVWQSFLKPHFDLAQLDALLETINHARSTQSILPSADHIFRAFELTPPDRVRVVVLGQDPYPTPGHAHGLSFSVLPGVKIPASLRNIFKELQSDLGIPPATHGHLESWATQGVFLLNTVLTVIAGEAGSNRKMGWEQFTDAVITALSNQQRPLIFWLWGRDAQAKKPLITNRHIVHESAHPSPLSARHGFFGSRPFSKTNLQLVEWGQSPIDWRLSGSDPGT